MCYGYAQSGLAYSSYEGVIQANGVVLLRCMYEFLQTVARYTEEIACGWGVSELGMGEVSGCEMMRGVGWGLR